MPENNDGQQESAGEAQQQEQKTFTQEDVNRIVRERAERLAKQLYPDYDELKSAAEGAKTVEQKLADLEKAHAEAEARALRSEIAARHGILPEDRDLFLTGSDEATLEAQASRLAAREAERKKTGNVAPREGDTKNTGKPEEASARDFAAELFGGGGTD